MDMTAGIVGCGPRGIDHAVALGEVDGVDLGGMVDLATERRERAQAELGVTAYAETAGEGRG
ncbi:MAG: hypothetical protein ACJ75Z_03150 [Solirubrobacterales bacterium]